ncbi:MULTISPECIES: MFS transporter [Paenibacillus]|uniref:MFS transporter n=1 Tax=Paenibacillus violae TaxID=3077234 RepID=A0ABU3RKT7_9BACL|nr:MULTISPECIES: MFS transporter [Paenibacillus]MDU0204624.1 MFS transporter [Paenibacillus sp. PFR10]MEC0266387.1 MFS transporter [Paenibacillus anseongense]
MADNSWKRNLFVLWVGTFLVSMAYTVSIPFMSIFLQDDLGVQNHLELWTGVVFAITFLAAALIAPFWGSMADKYGRKPMMLRAGICLSIAYFLYFIVQNPYELILVRIIEGLLAGYIPSAIALVATNTPEKHVGYALGIISTSGAAASVIGPLVGGSVSYLIGTRETFLLAGVMVLIAFVIAWVWVKEPSFVKTEAKRSSVLNDLKEALANRTLVSALFIVFITSTSIMILEPLLTIYVLKLGSSQSSASLHAGIIFSAVGVATLIAAPRWGKLGSKLGYEKVLFIGLIGGGIGNFLQILFHDLIGFGTLRFVYGLFFAAVFPALNAFIATHTEPGFRSRAFSLNQSANQMGLLLGPLIGGFLATQLSIPVVFAINGSLLLLVAVLLKLPKFSFQPRASTAKEMSK